MTQSEGDSRQRRDHMAGNCVIFIPEVAELHRTGHAGAHTFYNELPQFEGSTQQRTTCIILLSD